MRTRKYRVWNIQDKCWDNPAILEVWDDSGKLEPSKYIKTGKLDPIYMPVENYIVTEATDIFDKNRKEIWEGDVVKYGNRTGTIEWFAGMYVLSYGDETEDVLGFMMTDDMEVVGNIFETESLKSKKTVYHQ
jgi:hypothetical protein